MNLKSLLVAACGLLTSLATAALIVFVARVMDFNLFTFGVWFVIPVGALLAGCAAASGYYFGSLALHQPARWPLLAQMVLIAGFTQWLIYYGEYRTDRLDDGTPVMSLVDFTTYLKLTLTTAHYSIDVGHGGGGDIGEVGRLGYGLAALHFAGFLVGGAAVYLLLRRKTVCERCSLYFRPLAKRKKLFGDAREAVGYHSALAGAEPGSPAFATLAATAPKPPFRTDKGAVEVLTELRGCPGCRAQFVAETAQVYTGSEWKELAEFERRLDLPPGRSLLTAFQRRG